MKSHWALTQLQYMDLVETNILRGSSVTIKLVELIKIVGLAYEANNEAAIQMKPGRHFTELLHAAFHRLNRVAAGPTGPVKEYIVNVDGNSVIQRIGLSLDQDVLARSLMIDMIYIGIDEIMVLISQALALHDPEMNLMRKAELENNLFHLLYCRELAVIARGDEVEIIFYRLDHV